MVVEIRKRKMISSKTVPRGQELSRHPKDVELAVLCVCSVEELHYRVVDGANELNLAWKAWRR